MDTLTNELLLTTLKTAAELSLDKRFIFLLHQEIQKRQLILKEKKPSA
ncbi:MAG: sporulation histidine kinase inhibitor Sda [Bacillota bacterium]